MTENIAIIDPIEDERWQRFLQASPSGGIFHHPEWLSLLSAQYGYEMRAHCVLAADREIVAGLPFAFVKSHLTGSRLVAMPFSDVCGPVCRENQEWAITPLLDSVRGVHERDRIEIEIRSPVKGIGRRGASFYQHEISLGTDLEAVRRGFSSSTRRAITKSQREGVEVTQETGAGALDAFYALHLRTRHRQGVPTQPKRFIRRFTTLFERNLGFVLLARSEETTIAAAVFLCFNGVMTYKYGASHPGYLNKRPNNAIFIEAMRWGCANGYASVDLGRTDVDNEGLRAFKRGWGATEHELAYTVLSRRQEEESHGGVPRTLRWLITRTPAITGRLVGEALYGHFG